MVAKQESETDIFSIYAQMYARQAANMHDCTSDYALLAEILKSEFRWKVYAKIYSGTRINVRIGQAYVQRSSYLSIVQNKV